MSQATIIFTLVVFSFICFLTEAKLKTRTTNANEICRNHAKSRNYKDHYSDPLDCHNYIQCFFVNETIVFGYRRKCPPNTFWHNEILQCLPEATRCKDMCRNGRIYGSVENCRQYFTCVNGISNPACCPPGEEFSVRFGQCAGSTTCKDDCAVHGSTVAMDTSVWNASFCHDDSGIGIMRSETNPQAFRVISKNGNPGHEMLCPPTLVFDLFLCQCNQADQVQKRGKAGILRKAFLWMPFDVDAKDHSVHKTAVVLVGANRDSKTAAVTGGGSLDVRRGYLEIPQLRLPDFKNKLSICYFFK